ncbi:GMP synthase (glutamine-hydrolyzing) [Sulfurimonas denitrificans DSM 1251]|uniref:GMP synthase [glutamine-hydrolyzing] n=1 Tax=Sulfurimonas denitrificans (strain ATCC 33889 / DSM 1251) TaxID=326298 RepID=GUAA_SULDN|nr:glutamine-hydrolyzing GMP synthase [Sulfurimonas denitrificans]Q30TH8.1 RecName: Full=GMP synthase [glutamine-hydrolyzing]; AltName: Full=GMP synthetase; AltName: Full=Glutamine amidotransferase [Sulfurimonas denitrificans DSM 1251]ABB43703.1 GMP synthase (glutamine-hydrolyzing) [Sulfurimonas denitrificans DSM 1251]
MTNVSIIVLDFGSQYTQLIARRLREDKIYCEILPYHTKVADIKAKNPQGIILSGGPSSVYNKDAYEVDQGVYKMDIPVLGICYGMQRIAADFGGSVVRASHHEYGKAELKILNLETNPSPLFKDCDDERIVWMSHSDKVDTLPAGFEPIAVSSNSPYAAIANEEKRIYAMQYHPEVQHSEEGYLMLRNFARNICGVTEKWKMEHFLKEQIKNIRAKVGSGKVLCGLSGGVDSSVVAAMLYEAIGDQLVPVFVDNGLLRKGEREQVEEVFKINLKVPLVVVDARENFLSKLAGVSDPEKKRKIIGHTFIEEFEKEAKKHDGIKFLAQGTLYPDVIESISVNGPSEVIKSHHNVGGLPDWMDFELIEPLRELFKDEVRKIGLELGLPESMINRHPFPGPGLAIRIMGDVNEADLTLLREADVILLDELKASGYYAKTWQAFVVLLNVKSVGVMGDNRTYDNTVCVRVVEAVDGMTATFAHLPHDLLERISRRIINEVDGINRVVYDISSKPPATIEWE